MDVEEHHKDLMDDDNCNKVNSNHNSRWLRNKYAGDGSIRILRTLSTHYEIYGTNCETIDYVKK